MQIGLHLLRDDEVWGEAHASSGELSMLASVRRNVSEADGRLPSTSHRDAAVGECEVLLGLRHSMPCDDARPLSTPFPRDGSSGLVPYYNLIYFITVFRGGRRILVAFWVAFGL